MYPSLYFNRVYSGNTKLNVLVGLVSYQTHGPCTGNTVLIAGPPEKSFSQSFLTRVKDTLVKNVCSEYTFIGSI